MFLSSVFPLSEPSGLNKKGAFNTENSTTFEAEEELSASAAATVQGVPGESSMGADGTDGDAVADSSGGTDCTVDAAFYQTLWSSQRFFKEPQLLQVWRKFPSVDLQLINFINRTRLNLRGSLGPWIPSSTPSTKGRTCSRNLPSISF